MDVTTPSEPFVTRAFLEPAPVRALWALFDDGLPLPDRGDPLPPLWHWVALPEWAPAGITGRDGHPVTGGFLPDVGKPRRMFAGGRVELHAPLLVGSEVRREDRVLSVTPKKGRQGDFVLVKVEVRVYDAQDALALVEVQDLVYRDAVPAPDDPRSPAAAPTPIASALLQSKAGDRWSFQTDPTKLLRFSAATSNGHRIHYDHPYATAVEGYPGLVVHGPLMTLSLAEVFRLTDGRPIQVLEHRNQKPLFCGQGAEIHAGPSDEASGPDLEVSLVRGEDVHARLSVTFG